MEIKTITEDKRLTVVLSGRLDTTTAPEFEKEMNDKLVDAEKLVLDLLGLNYVSSAGLRVILKLQKLMNKKGGMKLINVSEEVMEILEITGFVDILTIE